MLKTLFIISLSLAASSAHATTIIYNVNQTIAAGNVMGTIETDGALGALTQSDITGFNLQISGPGAAIVITQADSIIRTDGNDLTATASDLLFNYSGSPGYLLFQFGSFGTGQKYYCNSAVSGDCYQGASAVPESINSPSAQVEPRGGNQVIASTVGSVPEPAIWTLMLCGFGMVGAMIRRKPIVKVVPN